MNTKHKWYDVIVAWANGENIQYKSKSCGDYWEDFTYGISEVPSFDSNVIEWRIKPKTITKKYRMALVKPNQWRGDVIAVDVTNSSIDDPIEYNVPGFIRWVGDIVEVEVEV